MGRSRKITPETISRARELLLVVPLLKMCEIKRKLSAEFAVSDRTSASILKLAKETEKAEEIVAESAQQAGELFPMAEVVGTAPGADRLFDPEHLPDKEEVRRILKAKCLNILGDPNEYAKNKMSAAKNLVELYKLNEPDVDVAALTPEESDQMLAKAFADLFMLPKDRCQFLPEYEEGKDATG